MTDQIDLISHFDFLAITSLDWNALFRVEKIVEKKIKLMNA